MGGAGTLRRMESGEGYEKRRLAAKKRASVLIGAGWCQYVVGQSR